MIFFKKVVIENFQSHVHTECTFHPGLNVFVGPSDSGKSAILRALRWVLFNTPRGTDFIRVGTNLCKVELHLSDGTIITRVRNHTSINRYQLKKLNEEELIFEGFGSEVPLEIARAHQIRPLQLEQKDILLQMGHQLEGPFLLSESSGVKAKIIGLVSGAHLIDLALKRLNSDRNQLVSKSKYIHLQQETIEQKLLPYQNLVSLEEALQLTETKAVLVKEKQSLLIQLKQLSHKYQLNIQDQKEQKAVLEKYPHLIKTEHKLAELECKLLKLRQYLQVSSRYRTVQQEQKQQQAIYQRTNSLSVAESMLVDQENKLSKTKQYQHLHQRYQIILKDQEINQQIYQRTKQLSKSAQKLNELITKKQQFEFLIKLQRAWKQMKIAKERELTILARSSQLTQLIEEQIPKTEFKLSRLQMLSQSYKNLVDKQERITKGHKCIADTEKKLRDLFMEYGELLTEQGKCPTCGSEINDTLIQHLLVEIGGSHYAAAGRED